MKKNKKNIWERTCRTGHSVLGTI